MSDTTPRDQLAEDIGWLLLQRPHPEMPSLNETEAAVTGACVAGAMAGLGWRPPARVVATVEELDALADMSVIRDAQDRVMRLCDGEFYEVGYEVDVWPTLPATVLYEPKEDE